MAPRLSPLEPLDRTDPADEIAFVSIPQPGPRMRGLSGSEYLNSEIYEGNFFAAS